MSKPPVPEPTGPLDLIDQPTTVLVATSSFFRAYHTGLTLEEAMRAALQAARQSAVTRWTEDHAEKAA